jgi:hypothetical protein
MKAINDSRKIRPAGSQENGKALKQKTKGQHAFEIALRSDDKKFCSVGEADGEVGYMRAHGKRA